MNLFWSSPTGDMELLIKMLVWIAIIAVIVALFHRRILSGVVVFSILGNIVVFLNVGSRLFYFYNIEWLQYVAVFFWPILNIGLLVWWLHGRKKSDS